ncbi:MAG: RDD family protein [Candidatus Pacebacteria bacterium]|nr:RDD family protein [Candidatus Paceibacterota bacterium]
MPNEQLVAHIRSEFVQGVDRAAVVRSLLGAGWQVEDINAAIAVVDHASSQNIPTAPSGAPQLQYTPAPTVSTIKYAGFWVRAGAVVVDGIILGLVGFVVSLVFGGAVYAQAISTIIGWFLIVYMVTKYQASPGKMAAGLHIERTSGDRLGAGRAILRELVGKFLSAVTLGIGYLMVAWTKKKQGLHDMVADTVVVENDPGKSKTIWVVIGVLGTLVLPLVIIGLMATIVFASLNVARMKGYDAMVESQLSTVQIQAVLYHGGIGNGSYLGYCNSPGALTALADASRAGTVDNLATSYVCNDSKDEWAASVPLRTTASYECAASTGVMTEIASPLASGQTSCGSSVQ